MSALPQLHGIRAVAIDLDGTMVDTSRDFLVAVNRLRADLQLAPISLEAVTHMVGRGTEYLVRQVLAVDFDAGGIAARLTDAMAIYLEHYRVINGQNSTVFPGVVEGLAALRARDLHLACITNKPFALADALLTTLGLRASFEIVLGGDSLPRRKPDPMPLLKVCSDLSLAPAALLMIGDSTHDATAARAAGCPVLVVPYGFNHGEDVQSIDADGIVSTLRVAADCIVS